MNIHLVWRPNERKTHPHPPQNAFEGRWLPQEWRRLERGDRVESFSQKEDGVPNSVYHGVHGSDIRDHTCYDDLRRACET